MVGRDLSGLENTWRRLLADDPAATVFQSWEWNSAWWRHFGAGRTPLVMVAHGPEGPLALAPLAARRGAGGLFRRVEFFGTGVSDYLAFIGSDQGVARCAGLFLSRLAQQPRWDVVDLQQINPGQAARAGLAGGGGPERLHWQGCAVRWGAQEVCPVAALPATWEELLRGLGKKTRFNIGYYERLLRRDYEVSTETAGAAEAPAAVEEFFRLHAERWRQRWQPGALYARRLLDFHRDVAQGLAAAGFLALHRLKADGQTIAALYCFHYGGRAFYYLGGFSPAFARYSPGTVLTAYAMRCAIAAGCREFDFLRGPEPYKYRWPVQERENFRLEIGRRDSSRSIAAMQWNALLQAAEERGKALLRKM